MNRINLLTQAGEPMRRLMRILRQILYWGLPPLILYLIFRRIDLERLRQILSNAESHLILIGIAMIMLVVVAGSLRWHTLLRRFDCALPSFSKSIGEYWKSLAVGVLIPGSLGSDAYRVMVIGRQKGYYLRSAFVIGVEKFAALLSCAVLIAGLYPLLSPNHLPKVVAQIVDALYLIFVVGIAFGTALILVRRQRWAQRLAEAFEVRLESFARRVEPLASTPPTTEENPRLTALALMGSAFSPAVALPTIGLSLMVMFISAIQSQLFFHGLGYDISFFVNLFVTPLLFLLFTLPLSFGGIGIREGAFILLYGAFGVPTEIALVVSFCSLLSVLFSYAIGAFLFLLEKRLNGSRDVLVGTLPSEKVMK